MPSLLRLRIKVFHHHYKKKIATIFAIYKCLTELTQHSGVHTNHCVNESVISIL